jgi:hypothetical protein
MTPNLTDERKAAIRDYLRTSFTGDPRADLKKVLIDPGVSDKDFLTDEMIGGLLTDVKPVQDTAAEITSDRVDTDQEPDLYVPDSEFLDYATNWDGTVICLGGARKKKGKRMRPYAGWAKTASGQFYPTCYFRLSQGGVRHIQTPAQMLMRRFKTLNPKPKSAA